MRLRVQQGLLLMTPISFFGSKVPLPGGEPECGPDEYKPEGLSRCCKQCPAGESQGIFWSLEGRPSQAGEGRLWALGAHRAGGWAGRPPLAQVGGPLLGSQPPILAPWGASPVNRVVGLFCSGRSFSRLEDNMGVHGQAGCS